MSESITSRAAKHVTSRPTYDIVLDTDRQTDRHVNNSGTAGLSYATLLICRVILSDHYVEGGVMEWVSMVITHNALWRTSLMM